MVRNSVDSAKFYEVYYPMAKEGKSAYDIGVALGVQGDKKEIAQFVSIKASNMRKALQTKAEAKAKAAELDDAATKALVDAAVAKMPKLQGRGRVGNDLEAMMDELLAKLEAADKEPEVTEPEVKAKRESKAKTPK